MNAFDRIMRGWFFERMAKEKPRYAIREEPLTREEIESLIILPSAQDDAEEG